MNTINFTTNPVRHIGTPIFAQLRLFNKDKHVVGTIHEIHFKGKSLGTAIIRSRVVFQFDGERSINETTAWLSFGKPLDYVKKILRDMHSPLTPDKQFAFLTLEWHTRDIGYQESLLQEWWATQREANTPATQGTLWNNA